MENAKLCLTCNILSKEEVEKCLNCGNTTFKILTKEEVLSSKLLEKNDENEDKSDENREKGDKNHPKSD